MNTLAHITGIVATLWLAVYGFVTLANAGLGVIGLLMMLWALFSTPFAVFDDINHWQGKESGKDRGD